MSKLNYNRPIYRTGKEVKIDEGNSPVLRKIYLCCGYKDKDIVKNLGAKWHPEHKLWYIYSNSPHLTKFVPFLHEDDLKEFNLYQEPIH